MPSSKNNLHNKHVLICRTDAVGDMVLAMPVCGLIKEYFPTCKISVLGRTYTRDIAQASQYIDGFVNFDDWQGKSIEEINAMLAVEKIDVAIHLKDLSTVAWQLKRAGIKKRIGTTNRVYHWFTCNTLVPLSRKNSGLHEAQLNVKLLRGLNIKRDLSWNEVSDYYGLSRFQPLNPAFEALLSSDKFNLIIHPKSHKNSKEWRLDNYSKLVHRIDQNRFKVFISGSQKEHEELLPWIQQHEGLITDISGQLPLSQFITFISKADGLIACSTGPVHIAAAAGIFTLGLYTDIKTKDAGRWGPVGKKAESLTAVNADMETITVDDILNKINAWQKP